MDLRVLTQADQLVRLREPWEALLARSSTGGVFVTPDWLLCWHRHYGNGARPQVVAVFDGPELVALAPLGS